MSIRTAPEASSSSSSRVCALSAAPAAGAAPIAPVVHSAPVVHPAPSAQGAMGFASLAGLTGLAGLACTDRDLLDAMTRAIVKKLMNSPLQEARALIAQGEHARLESLLQAMGVEAADPTETDG